MIDEKLTHSKDDCEHPDYEAEYNRLTKKVIRLENELERIKRVHFETLDLVLEHLRKCG